MRGSRGLTLVEVTVALAITSLLMVTALATLVNVSRAEAANQGRVDATETRLVVQRLLARDLAHARSWQATSGGFTIMTEAALDADTLELTHQSAEVSYQTRQLGPHSYLLRTQKGPGKPLTELVSPGVTGIALHVVAVAQPGGKADVQALPPAVKISVTFEGPSLGTQEFTFRTGVAP